MFLIKRVVVFIFIFGMPSEQASSVSYEFTKSKAPRRSIGRLVINRSSYGQLVNKLMDRGYYFAAIPFAKEVLASGRVSGSFSKTLEKLIGEVGIRQFETLPESILTRSGVPVVRYIRAKKLFRKGQYRRSLDVVRGISIHDSIGPFIYMLKGSAYALMGDEKRAVNAFDECASDLSGGIGNIIKRKKQYQIAKDYCTIGKARSLFALKRYDDASSTYLDLEKSSFIWPEILFEEAWTSFYKKNYNRTLGKLVTYRAPVFQNFFIPEIDILKSLTYMEMCLWSDAKKTIDSFDRKYLKSSQNLGRFINGRGRDHEYFYQTARMRNKGPVAGGELYNDLLRSVIFEPGYQELKSTIKMGAREHNRLKRSASRSSRILLAGVKDSIRLQKRLIGGYVRKQLVVKYALLRKAFTQMAYIKLEVLKRNKSELYKRITSKQRERGDIKYLSRNEKQYFWGFNGEFWADELGDYVFALPSEC